MSFFLDREGHNKFLRVATNQKLEARSQELIERVELVEGENEWLHPVRARGQRAVLASGHGDIGGPLQATFTAANRHNHHNWCFQLVG